jgi:hypothetical protein
MKFTWDTNKESAAVKMKSEGFTYSKIAEILDTTEVSVKHKIRRINQSKNQDKYKHTKEKSEQIDKFVSGKNKKILETHAGFGSLTEKYSLFGNVYSIEMVQERVDFVNSKKLKNVECTKGDSEKEILSLLYNNKKFDVIDVDPYGFPSRYFPTVFGLIDDGVLFLTFPVMGVAQINKITIEHYRVFWDINLSDKDCYTDKIVKKLKDYAFMQKRSIEVLEIKKIDRIYRFAIKVKQESLLKIVGLEVNKK